jgi:putative nucleotidyltransferase with HDIG domain
VSSTPAEPENECVGPRGVVATPVGRDARPPTVGDILDRAGELAVLPHVLLHLMRMTNSPDASAIDLEEVILTDQAVAARVLALANSAYFGLPRKVYFVREAVVYLGFRTMRNLAMTVHAVNMFLGRSDALSLSRAHLWHHSLDVALTAKRTAEHLKRKGLAQVSSEMAFTAGLLHDIGKMVLDLAMPAEYLLAVRALAERGMHFVDVEGRMFPYSHSEVGAALGERWNLPEPLIDALAHHHDPEHAEVDQPLVAVVALGNELTGYLRHLVDGPEQITAVAPALYGESTRLLGLKPDDLPELIVACQMELEQGMALHSCL